ncbi:esterase [Flavobacterium akiainvivens]|uniref:Esterase n=1 Tax=Flavobacterium akiainvivens TaxID=1202724 RepID=A0A0M9VJG1_9FLAO|nr:alpha/beta hydrolase-fold protein [Flavobacterium akiainvivens]KOS07726.1 esterase [Flavobacterium akiainvivens]SFQ25105.1 hypothetical protein SAMN05444144_102180 [Flavobacterium akiainvivens]
MKPLYILLAILTLSCAKAPQQPADPIPAHNTFTIASKQLGETRTINVWTPEGYAQATDSLPVMYMADGGIKEDFPHIANTFSELIKAKKIKPFILVGIENIQRRKDLTPPTTVAKDKEVAPVVGGSGAFRAFVANELFAEVNKHYRTTAQRGILGESLSGLFVMETFFLEPQLFDYYIAFDPSLWWNNHNLVTTARQNLAKMPQGKTLWFAGSGATDISQYTKQLEGILKATNTPGLRWAYSDEPNEEHGTIFRATKEKALVWALGK